MSKSSDNLCGSRNVREALGICIGLYRDDLNSSKFYLNHRKLMDNIAFLSLFCQLKIVAGSIFNGLV